jgi:hypothetical protein
MRVVAIFATGLISVSLTLVLWLYAPSMEDMGWDSCGRATSEHVRFYSSGNENAAQKALYKAKELCKN